MRYLAAGLPAVTCISADTELNTAAIAEGLTIEARTLILDSKVEKTVPDTNGAGIDGGRGMQTVQIHTIIILGQEDRLTILPTLEDMLGHVDQRIARQSRHSKPQDQESPCDSG